VEALLALINRARVKLAASGSNSPDAMICYEAGYEGLWLYGRLIALGIRVVVVDPASLLVDRRAMRARTDRIDARSMVRALMAWARGERQVLSEVRVPTDEQDDARRGLRERQRSVKERTTHGNRINRFAEDTRDHGLRSPGHGCGGAACPRNFAQRSFQP
jgi:transposase